MSDDSPFKSNIRPLISKEINFSNERFQDLFSKSFNKLLNLKNHALKIRVHSHEPLFYSDWINSHGKQTGLYWEFQAHGHFGLAYLPYELVTQFINLSLGGDPNRALPIREEFSQLDLITLKSMSSLFTLSLREGIRPFHGNIDIEMGDIYKDAALMNFQSSQNSVFTFEFQISGQGDQLLGLCLMSSRF